MQKWLLLSEILDQSVRVGAKSPIFHLFSLVATNPQHLAKKVQLTLIIGSPLHAFEWAHTLSLSPQRVARKRIVSKIWTISCDNSETARDRMSVTILLITNRKSHTGFRLVPTSMMMNDLERHNSPYFAFFPTEFDRFSGRLYHSGWR